MPQSKFKQIAQAKAQWDAELKEWRCQTSRLFKLEKQLKAQRARVHKAYMKYKALVEKDLKFIPSIKL